MVFGILFEIDLNFVRGFDYYNYIVFEIMSNVEGFGVIIIFVGGGCYDGFVEQIGGLEVLGIGFVMSIECLLAVIDVEKIEFFVNQGIDCYIVMFGEKVKDYFVFFVYKLREVGILSEIDYENKKMKG